MKCVSGLSAVLFTLLPHGFLAAAPSVQQQVLARETLWLSAISAHDASMLATILDDGFVHTNYKGQVEGKAAMLVRIGSGVPYAQRTSDRSVALLGPVVIVHGLNTASSGGHVVARLRYTDVYVMRGSVWKAISAQETLVQM